MHEGTGLAEPRPSVAVLLATYNGASCIREQLESFLSQTRRPDLILVSDDGSSDDTLALVDAFRKSHPEICISITKGPCRGSAQNFLSLLRDTPDWIDVVALSDQDDVWLPDKLERGLSALSENSHGSETLLYCARTFECDAQLNHPRLSRGITRPPAFRHALVQNIAGGNTMMLNRAALDLVRDAAREVAQLVVHDWWIYQIVTGAGGRVIFDPRPVLLYRQHGGNLIGANTGITARLRRVRLMLSGVFRHWNTINVHALKASYHRLTPDNQRLLTEFEACRQGPVQQRLRLLRRARLYRQGFWGLVSLYAAALFGWL